MAAPSVYFTHSPLSLLKFTPSSLQNPPALPPPISDHSLAQPFNVNPELYNDALHVAIPITFAIVYATTVNYVNSVNRKRDHEPWAFSKSLAFYAFVLVHNIFLALYSGWTFIGMFHAIKESWPGWDGEYGLAGVADTLCKIHGPRGLGSATTYNSTTSSWGFTDRAMKLAEGIPDSTDVGRIWNEGLAFYGWLFYLSKFYEVVDTAIILAKGKRSSLLQTYHHAGSLMCMWAGIRYMSPPIWMFVFINSGLHALMYTYYTLSALTIKVPRALKRTLTTLQIVQFVFGASYAVLHLFVAYDILLPFAYLYVHSLSTSVSSVASTVSSAIASSTASAGFGSVLKKAALRAAGNEGLAENVRNNQGEPFGIDAVHAAEVEKAQEEIRYRMGYTKVHCLDTPGQAFAIVLNAIYLVPLTYLFIAFFIRSYTSRAHSEPPKLTVQENIKESSKDAEKDVRKELSEAMAEHGYTEDDVPLEVREIMFNARGNMRQEISNLGEKAQNNVKDANAKAQKGFGNLSNRAKDVVGDLPAQAQNGAEDWTAITKKGAKDAKDAILDDLKALQEMMRKKGVEELKAKEVQDSKENENSEPKVNGSNKDKGPKEDSKPTEEIKDGEDEEKKVDDDEQDMDGDAQSYEAVPDEPKSSEERKAEAEMQPN